MAILVVCQCGKRFKADDSLAGRRGKCPACKQLIVVSGPDVWVPAVQSVAVSRPPATRMAINRRRAAPVVLAAKCAAIAIPGWVVFGSRKAVRGLKQAEVYIERDTNRTLKEDNKLASYTIDSIVVEPVAEDPRKIPWLWNAEVRVTAAYKPTSQTDRSVTISWVSRDLYNYDPDGLVLQRRLF
jgi:hypothetical protein